MRTGRYLISSLLMAGLGSAEHAAAEPPGAKTTGDDDPNRAGIFKQFKLDHLYQLASHSSHSSHSSHASHRSGSGGGYAPGYPTYRAPAVDPDPAPTASPLVSTPTSTAALPAVPTTPRTLSGRTDLFTSIVRRVQLGLLAYGYYQGPITGVVGPDTRAAIKRMQADFKLPVTGTVTPQLLDTLRIEAR